MQILSLNTQKAFQPTLAPFLRNTLESNQYDFILLQETTDKVLPLIRDIGSYTLLEAFDTHMGTQGHLVIAYRNNFELKDSVLDSYGTMHPSPRLRHTGLGALVGTFQTPSGNIKTGSVHLHAGLRATVRAKELARLKQSILSEAQDEIPTILGGDFNLGFPGEVLHACMYLSPEFVSKTRQLGTTLNSRFSEPNPNLVNMSAVFLSSLGIGFNLKTDHFFTDRSTASRSTARILPDRVSDHSPIELVIS